MTRAELQDRTRQFNIDIILLCQSLPRSAAGFELARQLIRSAGSVGANYRASRRAKSKADFIYKIQVVLEEADESLYWLEVISGTGLLPRVILPELNRLMKEADELTAIFSKADKTIKAKSASNNANELGNVIS